MSLATERASYEEGWTNNFETLATKKEWTSYEDSTPTMKQARNEETSYEEFTQTMKPLCKRRGGYNERGETKARWLAPRLEVLEVRQKS